MRPDGVSPGGRPYRLAICDDKKFEVSELKLFLSSRGFYVQSFENGRQLVDHVSAKPGDFDLIILDISMPVLDGYAAFFEMKDSGRMPKILFYSVENTQAVVRHVIENGASDYVTRPCKKEDLLERIKTVVGKI